MKYLYLAILISLTSCGQKKNNSDNKVDTLSRTIIIEHENSISLKDKTAKFLWREEKYDENLKDTFNTIVINDELCKNLTDPERAALGFVVTFIGSECQWDGEAKDDLSNLKCKTLTALDLGYQCSNQHLDFLRKWFKNDSKSLEILKDCPTVPYTANSQNTFDFINLKVIDNVILVEFSASGINMRMGENWEWTETDYFKLDKDNLKLIKKNKSKVVRDHFKTAD
jgi:hypothetical protein